MAKEPSQFEMKKQFNLPEDAVFLGWVIHHPENDEYVVTYTSNEYMANIGWGLSPGRDREHFESMLRGFDRPIWV
jgi:hypothetical protein